MTTLPAHPLVSIVTPAYNSAHVIERTIASVMAQDYPRIEHIVVDGGSTDGTVDIVRRHDHLRWVSERDRGQSDAINKGFCMAQGQILAWINADDTYNPGAVSTAVQWLQQHPEVGLVHSDYTVIDADDRHLYEVQAIDFELDQLFLFNEIPGQFTAFWRRDVLDAVGPLNEQLHYLMDYDLWLRIAMAFPVKHIPDVHLANFRLCPGTKTYSHPEAFRREADQVVTCAFQSDAFAALPPEVQRRARASGLRHRACAACYLNDPAGAAAHFRAAAESYPDLRARDVQVLLWNFGACAQSPLVGDAIELLRKLFAEALPPEIARLRRRVFGFVHHACALDAFGHDRLMPAGRHLARSFWYSPAFMRNRGMWSMLAQTIYGKR